MIAPDMGVLNGAIKVVQRVEAWTVDVPMERPPDRAPDDVHAVVQYYERDGSLITDPARIAEVEEWINDHPEGV